MSILSILLGIVMLGMLIGIHEFGHFFFARICSIEVKEFSLGFGRKLVAWTGKKGTKYSIRLIPMGGFCAFYGEDDITGSTEHDPRAYNNQSVWKRILSVVMGPGMNFILAIVVAVLMVWIGGTYVVDGYQPVINEVMAVGAAQQAGLQPNDVIIAIDGRETTAAEPGDLLSAIAEYQPEQGPMMMTIQRGSEQMTVQITPRYVAEDQAWRIGIMSASLPLVHTSPATFIEAVNEGWEYFTYYGGAIINALRDMVTTGEGLEDTAGPVGTVGAVSQVIQESGISGFVRVLILLSVNLGIMNLLPIPGLDGCRLLFMLFEAIFRKPVPRKIEAVIHLIGFVLLFGLLILLTFRDVARFFQ